MKIFNLQFRIYNKYKSKARRQKSSDKRGFTLIRTRLRRNLAALAVRTRLRRNLVNVQGFTLIELLVVISIIGILAAIAIVSFTSAQKQARNANRKSDLKQYQTSLEQFANTNNGFYVSRTGKQTAFGLCTDLGLTSCPDDPRYDVDNTHKYTYTSNGSGGGNPDATEFKLYAKLENDGGTTTYWVLCSNGISGEVTDAISNGGACPF